MYETQYDAQLFAELYDVQPQAIVWSRPIRSKDGEKIIDFEYTYSNDEGLNYLNLSRAQLAGLTISNSPTLTDELRKSIFDEMMMVYTTGQKSETAFFNPALNKYARVLRSKLRNGILTVIQDRTNENLIIRQLETQTQQLEEQTRQLREQKALLDNILLNSSNGISVSKVFRDEGGKVVDSLTILANDAAVKYIGLPKDIYFSKKASEIEPGIIGSPYYQACINTLETGEPLVMQYYMKATSRWLELTVSKMDYNHLIQVFSDVSPIKEFQLRSEKAASTLKTVFDTAQTGMFTCTPEYNKQGEIIDFRLGMVNSTVAGFIGESPEEMQGQLGKKFFPGYLATGAFELYKQSFDTGEPQRKEVYYNVDGHDNYLDLQSVRIDDHLLVTVTDHTSLRKSELELQQTVKALERSNTNLEDFAHAASHDMKEPLRKILTFTDRLKSTLAPRMTESEIHMCERIVTSAERMQLLVDDLLEFSHISEKPRGMEPVDLNEKIERVLSDLELPIEEKSAQFIIDPLPTVQGNRRQLQQLFHNLISNALKYSKQDVPPYITIRSRPVKGNDPFLKSHADLGDKIFYLIEVTDNGIGFQQQYAEKIFKMFQRLHGKSRYSGTGVGLSIARKVVQNHNGYLWAESELNKGATFRILLPTN